MTGTVAAGAGVYAAKKLGPQLEKLGARITGQRKTEAELKGMGWLGRQGYQLRRRYGAPVEMVGRQAASQAIRRETEEMEKLTAQLKKLSGGEILNRYKTSVTDASRAAALRALLEKDPAMFKDAYNKKQFKREDVTKAGALLWQKGHQQFAVNSAQDDDHIREMAMAIDPKGWTEAQQKIEAGKKRQGPILSEYDELNDKLATETDPAKKAVIQAKLAALNPQVQRIIGAMTPQEEKDLEEAIDLVKEGKNKHTEIMQTLAGAVKDPTKLSPGVLKNPVFAAAAVNTWSGSQIGQAANHFGKEAAEAFQKAIDAKGKNIFKENGSLSLWLTSGAATNAGLQLTSSLPTSMSQKDVRDELIKARVNAEKGLQKQTAALQKMFMGKEQLLLRDYYRAGTTEEMKKVIEGAIKNLGKTIPTKEAVSSQIGKQEALITKNVKSEIETLEKRRIAAVTYKNAGNPMSGNDFNNYNEAMRRTTIELNSFRASVKAAETKEASSLAKLW